MSSDQNTKDELKAIFPQHNEETITRIYNNVVESVGENSHVLVLPICIERLLELPSIENNTGLDNGTNFFNRATPPSFNTGLPSKQNKTKIDNKYGSIPGLEDDSDLSNDPYDSSSSEDEQDISMDDYRNKARPTYREHHHRSRSRSLSRSLSPADGDSLGGYFSDRDDSIFADLDNDLSELERFVPAKQKTEDSKVITILDSPIINNRKRKLVDEVITNSDDIIDLSITENGISNDESSMKKILLSGDIDNGIGNSNFIPDEPDLSTIHKGMLGFIELSKKNIKAVIEDIDNTYLENLINSYMDIPVSIIVQRVIEHLLDNSSYPRIVKTIPISSTSFKPSSTITSSMNTFLYNQQSVILLQNSFPKVSTKILRKIFNDTHNYTKAFDTMESTLKLIYSGEKKPEETIVISFLKGSRNKIKINDLCSTLTDEIKNMESRQKEEREKGDRETASALNSKQYDEEGQFIECGCCYNEVAFDDMVQCLEGHLFCVTCLQSYSKEAIYGSGKAQLFCMTDCCDSTFPLSQMKKALQGDLLDKYMERVQDEDIKLANICNLIRCPSCDFAAEMDDGDKVFRCQNTSCMKETCRYCQEEWKEHFGVPCKELEKKDAKNLRTTYEEKMTEAKVRKCWQCSTIFLKSDGCNKMTCRCGAKMCYICRKAKINYDHFCQHPRDPGNQCTQCKKCNLWTDPSEDDDRAVAEIKKEAEEERKKLSCDENTDTKISIGPAITVSTSSATKTKANNYRPHQQPPFPRHPIPRYAQPFQRFPQNQQILQRIQQLQQQQQLARQRYQGNW